MSHRPNIQKKLRRLKKSMRQPLPVYFDLVLYLKDRRYAQTTGEANRLILAGRVRSGSHTLGIEKVPDVQPDGEVKTKDVVRRIIPAHHKADLIVLDPA